MSLINQMLKDLDQRKASPPRKPVLAGDVRTVAPATPAFGWMAGVGGAALLLLGGGYVAWVQWADTPPASQLVNQTPPPVRNLPAPVDSAAARAASPPAVPEPSGGRWTRLETELHTVPAPEKKAAATPAAVPPGTGSVEPAAQDKPPETHPAKPARSARNIAFKSVTPQQQSDNLYSQAVAMLQKGRVAEARSTLWQALDENPSNHNARQLLVGLLMENKRHGDAMVLLQDGVKLAPEQTGFVMALARLQVEAGSRQAGLQTLEQGLKYADDEAEYQGFYAALLQREERHEEAVGRYLAALKQDPANISWLVGIGISLQAQGKYADAREAFQRARQLERLSPELTAFVDQRLGQLKGK